MYRVKVHRHIEQIITFLYRVRIWNRVDDKTVAEWTLKMFYSIYYFLFPVSLMAGGLASDNRDGSVFLAETSIITVVLLAKLLYMIWRKTEILKQLNCICDYDVKYQAGFTKINQKLNSFMKFVVILLSFIYFCAICSALVVPFLEDEKTLFFKIGFPLDWRNDEFAYWTAFIFIFTQVIISLISTLFSVISCYLMASCGLRYDALGQQIKAMGERKSVDETAIEMKSLCAQRDNLYQRDLIEAVTSHQHLEELTTKLRSFLSHVFAVQLTTSALCICTAIYCLAFNRGDTLIEILINVAVMLYIIFDFFMVMDFGNEIQLASDRLSYSLFESNWVDRSQSIKKNVIIFGELLMQPHQLNVLNLYPLNLKSFMTILNSAYSMFNILQNIK